MSAYTLSSTMAIRKRQLKKSTVWEVDYRRNSGHRRLKRFVKRNQAEAFERPAYTGRHVSDIASTLQAWLTTKDK